TGTLARGNGGDGVFIANGASINTIGGSSVSTRNVISGNNEDGVQITGGGTNTNVISGNYIGTNKNGDAAVANRRFGVGVNGGAANNLIGGGASGGGNLLIGNAAAGNASKGADYTLIAGNL